MAAPFIPWIPHNVPSEIQDELIRRKTSRSFNYVKNSSAQWDKSTGDWNTYRGPMVSWARMCSNSEGPRSIKKPRFVLHGGKGFDNTYGFAIINGNKNQQIIGYMPDGTPHIIDNDLKNSSFPIHGGSPEISKINVTVQKELFRRATIEWVCFSPKQLEYMTPFFLVPGISVLLEFGWNHFNPTSLVDIASEKVMKDNWNDTANLYLKNTLDSKGNYDAVYGVITNFGFEIQGSQIICTTEITSKDKLYAGLSKNNTLLTNTDDKQKQPGILEGIKKFVSTDDKQSSVFSNFKQLKDVSLDRISITNIISNYEGSSKLPLLTLLLDIKRLNDSELAINPPEVTAEQVDKINFLRDVKASYIKGIFAGREKGEFIKKSIVNERLPGDPKKYDFDFSENKSIERLWLNMGLIVEILNYFSYLPGTNDNPQFKVDIDTTVIGGHPNLISCDNRVLIPNYQAPKYFIGTIGQQKYSGNIQKDNNDANNDYSTQLSISKRRSKKISRDQKGVGKADERIRQIFYQSSESECFRMDLDYVINANRYSSTGIKLKDSNPDYSFPARKSKTLYNKVNLEQDYSGMLTNIYLNFKAFKDIVEDDSVKTYQDIYTRILDLLMRSVDGFWDLSLIESEGKLTIIDKNYINTNNKNTGNNIFSFDYYDADSFLKNIKFRPQLSDAQATRTIYGGTNNSGSAMYLSDKEDLLNYQFKDTINAQDIDPKKAKNNESTQLENSKAQMRDILNSLHSIHIPDDGTLQMTLNTGEIVKLSLPPNQQKLFRLILDDNDKDNNQRYCSIQPGITLEFTLQGIGGIRTFQYFLIKNFPAPYSENDVIFRVINVTHDVESGNWETNVQAGLLPLTNYIKTRLL